MEERLDEERIVAALERVSELLRERGARGEICLLGGTAMVLAFKVRPSTKDVDAIFQPARLIRELAGIVQREQDLPEGWLNDAAKGFLSSAHEVIQGDLPQFDHLRVTAPTAEYLLAMKCMASRVTADASDQGDVPDIRFLIRHLGLTSPEEAIAIVRKYYPEDRIPPRARFLIEDLMSGEPP